MRPDSIRKFDLFFLASVAMGAVSSFLSHDAQVAALTAQWEPLGMGDSSSAFVVGSSIVGILVNMLLWYLASRKRQSWVKWVLVVFVAFMLFGVVSALGSGFGSLSIAGLITLLLRGIAVYFLFRPDAKEWFAEKGE
ncbi:hypothetical protein [Aurantiacibacter sp. D1-12]|uniref:hypothetical protein n=1 Tax=Aurantiacibacter sp. D1-12 TaxID=2993658 RepID=UPI00237C63F8|nr:hypothetical protein [Aurantiacibacter sp. D1-12]MDE1468063.1 hypothetical protein [Aurantiacibacter sp. D1-12]